VSDERAHDPGRFARALELAQKGLVTQVGPMQYKVAGNEEKHYDVDLSAETPCYCADMWWSGQRIRNNCKHTLAARILSRDPSVQTELMELAYMQSKRKVS
jgi:hypothetical protein